MSGRWLVFFLFASLFVLFCFVFFIQNVLGEISALLLPLLL